MTRREMLFTIPALAVAPRIFAQASKPSIPLRGFNHFTLGVSDVKRSVDFYQGLFGMPIQARQGERVILRIGNGPQFIAIAPAGSASPSIMQTGLAVDTFDADRLGGILAQHGFTKADAVGPMKVRVSDRGGTTELHLEEPDGLLIQLQDASYCGGGRPARHGWPKHSASARQGVVAVEEVRHLPT